MHISTLKQLLEDHHDFLLNNNLLDDTHTDSDDVKDYLKLKENLEKFPNKDCDSNITTEYRLPDDLALSNNSKLSIAINDLLDLEIFTVISKPGLIDDNNSAQTYETIRRLSYERKQFLHRLFCDNSHEAIPLNNQIIDVIVSAVSKSSLISNSLLSLEKAIRLLNKFDLQLNQYYSRTLLDSAIKKGNSNSLFEIMTLLHNTNSLDVETLYELTRLYGEYDGLIDLLKKLSSAKVTINHALIPQLRELFHTSKLNSISAQLDLLLTILSTKPEIKLSTEDCRRFFHAQFNHDQCIRILNLLNEMGQLNQESFRKCLQYWLHEEHVDILSSIKHFISNKPDIQLDEAFWDYFTDSKANRCGVLNCLDFLNNNHLLNKQTFDTSLKATTSSKKQRSLNIGNLLKLFNKDDNPQQYNEWLATLVAVHSESLFKAVSVLIKNNICITTENYLSMLALSNRGATQLNTIVLNLAEQALLKNDSFQSALKRVSTKLPDIKETTIIKTSRKMTGASRSNITATDGQFNFFCDHSKRFDWGSHAKIKKGYSSLDATEAAYSVKIPLDDTDEERIKELTRHAKCNQLLGRAAFYFTLPESSSSIPQRLLSTWHQGQQLDKYTANELTTATPESLLKCMIAIFTDVNALHLWNIVHGDIKPGNVILDLKSSSMNLIDFGGSKKFNSGNGMVYTTAYTDPLNTIENHFTSDVYAMGVILMTLFPELYGLEPGKIKIPKRFIQCKDIQMFYHAHNVIKTSTLTMIERAIVQLVDCLMNADVHARCNSEDALNYCRELLSNLNKLDDALLEKITKSTIHRSQMTVEDAMRDSIRHFST